MTLIQVAEQGIGESMAFLSERTEKKHCLQPTLLMSIITPVDWGTGMVQIFTSLTWVVDTEGGKVASWLVCLTPE